MKLFEGPGLLIVLAIVLIIFGPKQLPQLGKALGQTVKSIRDGVSEDVADDDAPSDADI
jgi:sec-independent protein translocase protein TatA